MCGDERGGNTRVPCCGCACKSWKDAWRFDAGGTSPELTQHDTSDEAYLARHLRHERAEKKLRKQEKENLVRDRQKLLARIDSLEQVDIALLVPMLASLDAQHNKPPRSEFELTAHLTALHAELLADAKATLARYNKLLPSEAKHDPDTDYVKRPTRASTPLAQHTPTQVPRVVKESTKALGERVSPMHPKPPLHQRMGPTLAELAAQDNAPRADGTVYPTTTTNQRRNSTRRKAASAFGERVPEYALHYAPFETAMAQFFSSPS